MCYTVVQYVEYSCSHRYPTRRQRVDCNSRTCKISDRHNTEPHDCSETCQQRLLPDQGLIMDTKRESCSVCLQPITNGR
ncbi:hypothetical protein PLICRDRAFT_112868 [Plicaturopsis crispa FD-325 SS-3]|nr:hypothetical protein PLICRDRAFT_112868 [Plicaturopsis crispa FD-325 SS-3]